MVLHASGIIDNKKGVLFIGKSGHGKSSLTASLKSNQFISEDAIMIKKNKKEYIAYPSSPYLKLDPKIVQHLELNYSKKFKLKNDRLSRSIYKLPNFYQKPSSVKACYILNWGEEFKISNISIKDVIGELLVSSFTAYPINSCKTSAKDFNNFIFNFYNDIKFFRLTRSKSNLFNDNDKIIQHFKSI
jgi:GTPase SAR1 family protein